jgi:hypothetical protein
MKLLIPVRKAGYYIEFKVDVLLRGDITNRATYYHHSKDKK